MTLQMLFIDLQNTRQSAKDGHSKQNLPYTCSSSLSGSYGWPTSNLGSNAVGLYSVHVCE